MHQDAVGATICTQWIYPEPGADVDLEKHFAFCSLVVEVMREHMPELVPFLVANSARIVAAPGAFAFMVPIVAGEWHNVPAIAAHLNLLPWVDAHETAH